MHTDHEVFITALEGRQKVAVAFISKDDGGRRLVRVCAPMDYGPSRFAKDQSDRYHSWDLESDSPGGNHTLSLPTSQIVSITGANELFDPADFVTWEPNWHFPRDWGKFS